MLKTKNRWFMMLMYLWKNPTTQIS
jgi:hypothetical protein